MKEFEYWDEGDQEWRRMKNEPLEDDAMTKGEWLKSIGFKTRSVK